MKKRSVIISGHSTSITLEEEFWCELKNIASTQNISINKLISRIDAQEKGIEHGQNLSSTLRLYILKNLKEKIEEQGNDRQL